MNGIMAIAQEQTMSSLQIAELTGKQHSNVMRDIRKMAEYLNQFTSESVGSEYHRSDRTRYKYLSEQTQNALLDFAIGKNATQYIITEASYIDAKGEKRAMYNLNKKACFLLASGYDVVLRAKIIDRWEELETANQPKTPKTFAEALRLAADKAEENERLMLEVTAKNATIAEQTKAIDSMKPKVTYYDVILNNAHTLNVTAIASDYGMTPNKFNKLLNGIGIQKRVGKMWVPYAKYIEQGYTKISTDPNPNSKNGGTYTYSRWTQKGRLFLYETLKKKGILPLIEQP